MHEILKQLEMNEWKVTSQIIRDLIKEHEPKRNKMIRLFRNYKGEDLPIQNRKEVDKYAANNKLINDFRGEIVDQIVGYMAGHPIVYNASNEDYEEFLNNFRRINKIDDLDSKTIKMMTICGYAARLCYVDKQGQLRVMDVPPWETVFIKDMSLDEVQYAMRYYPITVIENGERKERLRVEWYDYETITFYIEDDNGEFVLDNTEEINPQPHLFKFVPLVKFSNNDEELGDFEKVESLINAYDRLISDAQNVIEDFRAAYIVFEGGAAPDPETIKELKKARAIHGPGKVHYLVKEINDQFFENQKETLMRNIYRFSQTLDLGLDEFRSGDSGEARKWRLLELETKAITKERKFSAALRDMFKVLCSYVGEERDYLAFDWTFKRNIPVDLQYLSDVVSKLKGKISDETLLGLLPFIDNPKQELQRMLEEYDSMLPALDVQIDEGDLDE